MKRRGQEIESKTGIKEGDKFKVKVGRNGLVLKKRKSRKNKRVKLFLN